MLYVETYADSNVEVSETALRHRYTNGINYFWMRLIINVIAGYISILTLIFPVIWPYLHYALSPSRILAAMFLKQYLKPSFYVFLIA